MMFVAEHNTQHLGWVGFGVCVPLFGRGNVCALAYSRRTAFPSLDHKFFRCREATPKLCWWMHGDFLELCHCVVGAFRQWASRGVGLSSRRVFPPLPPARLNWVAVRFFFSSFGGLEEAPELGQMEKHHIFASHNFGTVMYGSRVVFPITSAGRVAMEWK